MCSSSAAVRANTGTVSYYSPVKSVECLCELPKLTPVFRSVLSRSGERRHRKGDGSVPGNDAAAAGELDAQRAGKAAGHLHRA